MSNKICYSWSTQQFSITFKNKQNWVTELEPLNKETADKLLDFRDLNAATKEAEFRTYRGDYDSSSSDDEIARKFIQYFQRRKKKKSETDFKPAPKMNTFVGFLRLANYVNACCVIFGVVLANFLQDLDVADSEAEKEKRESGKWSAVWLVIDRNRYLCRNRNRTETGFEKKLLKI